MEPSTSWDTSKLALVVPQLLLRQTSLTNATSHVQVPLSHFKGSATSGLTLAPTRAASPTTLITLHKASNDVAVVLGASFRKSLSTTNRIIALTNNNLFAGFYVITPHKRI